jgi:hypothetical protein
MRKLTALLLAVTLIAAPASSTIAAAFGFSGEHVHYDHVWHAASERTQAKAAPHDHGSAAHHHDHDVDGAARQAESHHGSDGDSAPLKHSHPEQVHAASFVTVGTAQLIVPDIVMAVASAPASFPVQQHPYPPFRPPQAVLSA